LAEQGQREEGIAQRHEGMAVSPTTAQAVFLTGLAKVHGETGQFEEGLLTLAEVPALMDKNGQRVYEAESYRIKGRLTLQSRDPSLKSKIEEEAEGYFWKAIKIAGRQSAKSLELRAVMSLARLWQRQGKTKEARLMLTEIYGWFTEGFDTPDLKDAKALLEELEGKATIASSKQRKTGRKGETGKGRKERSKTK
jgi:ATP/maltotriose-dependent transcriptional regulator MalT